MKILEVTFDCTIAMPGYNNVKPGVFRAILEEGDTLEGAWTELNRRAKEWHKKEYPHIYQEQFVANTNLQKLTENYYSPPKPSIIDKSIERLEIQIDNANTLEELDKIPLSYDKLPDEIFKQIEEKKNQLANAEIR